MKNVLLSTFTACLFAMVFTSCESVDFAEIYGTDPGNDGAPKQTLQVSAMTTNGSIDYPVIVYAFDADGNYVMRQTITSASTKLSMSLGAGTYRIVAFSGTDGLTFPESPKLTTLLTIPQQSTSALQMGYANVTISNTSASAFINMGFVESNVQFTLSQIPDDATAVTVNVSNVATAMDFTGNASGTATTDIPLTRTITSGEWQSTQVNLMPSTETKTILTISIQRPNETETYAYTYPSALVAGTPYHFRGSYAKQEGQDEPGVLMLEGEFSAAVWNDLQTIDFSFGGNNSNSSETYNGSNDNLTTPYPYAGTIWNGHVVALCDSIDEHHVKLTLFSIGEWTNVASAKSEENPTQAKTIADSYVEGDITGWEIPTKDQAKAIKTLYDYGNTPSLSDLLEQVNGGYVGYSDISGDNTRYLCEDATYTYNFKQFNSVSVAGKNTLYRLRLVKTVTHSY